MKLQDFSDPNSTAFVAPSFLVSEQGFVVVPQQKAYVVERLGKFNAVLDAGWYFLIPFFDKIAYVHR